MVFFLVLLTFYLSFGALLNIIALVRSGKKEDLFFDTNRRIKSVFSYVFMHKGVMEDRSYGLMHLFYFYGFLILGLGHLELVLFGLTRFLEYFNLRPFLYKNFLPIYFAKLFEFSQDFMAISVIIIALLALFRRIVIPKARLLPRSKDAEIILSWIAFLYITYFIYVSKSNIIIHEIGFWSHLSLFLGFAVYIPNSKHLHLIAAGPNIYFRHFDEVAKPHIIDFEKSENFGADDVKDLSWKSLLDTFACTECGRCDMVCPANLTLKPLRPKKVLHDIKLNLRAKDKIELINAQKEYTEGQVHIDEIWACTTCAACVDVCPVLIDSVPTSLIEMRRNLVMMKASHYPKELNAAMRQMEMQKNPWGLGPDKRLDWALNLDVPLMKDKKEAQYLFWVGCAGATDDKAKKVQQALVRILKKANVDFAILGCEEKCTGDPARRMGNEYLFESLAKENIDTLSRYKFKKIFTSCPHCFNSLKNEYKDFGVEYSVQHHSELIDELFNDKKLSLEIKEKINKEVTFHDPCYLGRYNQGYEAPRNIIEKVIGKKPIEMPMNKRNSFCCGAGGGRMFMEERIGKRINHERVLQAKSTKAKTICTACPFCMTMMNDGINDKNLDEEIIVKDIAEIVASQI